MPMRRHNLPGEEEPQVFYYKLVFHNKLVQFSVMHTVIGGSLWTRYRQTNGVKRGQKSGKPKSTTVHQDR